MSSILLLADTPAAGNNDPFYSSVLDVWNFTTNADGAKGSTATLFGNAAVSGGALVLDGVGDYAEYTVGAGFSLSNENSVIEFFATVTGVAGVQGIITQWRNPTGNWEVIIAGGLLEGDHQTSPGGVAFVTADISAFVGVKTHYALVRSGGNMYLFAGGNKVATAANTNAGTSTLGTLIFGTRKLNGSDEGFYFAGSLHAVRATKGTDRGYTGATITIPTDPFPES